MDEYVHLVYRLTKNFPREELYGVTSQFRRASLSIVLNYIEGYARGRNKININFLEISFGSLMGSKYLLEFSFVEGYVSQDDFDISKKYTEEIFAMLWKTLEFMKSK